MFQKIDLKPVIGLEIHVQLNTLSKMFCSCPNNSDETSPNVNVCPICLAHPGTLPTANFSAVEKVIKAGLALNCKISLSSEFARKSYFYPDLPKGYQISQAEKPLCQNGSFQLKKSTIRIERIHLEEDTGRLIHSEKENSSLVDFNRAGVPLMELVTKPDFQKGEEVIEFAQELQLILRYLDISSADMEKGQMRVEANVSVQPINDPHASGVKVELKNLNSFKSVKDAIDYEIKRQSDIIVSGEKLDQETRGWDGFRTVLQRKKEVAQEYRYFPEPDLPPIHLNQEKLDKLFQSLPEMPQAKRKRFAEEYKLEEKDINILVREQDLGSYFEKSASELLSWMKDKKIDSKQFPALIKLLVNYLITDLRGQTKGSLDESKVTPENFSELITLIFDKKLPSRMAKDLLSEMIKTGGDPSQIMTKKNLFQMKDEKDIKSLVAKIITENDKAISDYLKGKTAALKFLVGQLMSATKGSVDPETAKKVIEEEIKKINQ